MKKQVSQDRELDDLVAIQGSFAIKIQRLFRRYYAKKTVHFMLLAHRGRRMKSCLTLQSAWRSYSQRMQVVELRKMLQIDAFARTFTSFMIDKEMIHFDIQDASADQKQLRRKMRKNAKFIALSKKTSVYKFTI